MTYSSGWRTAGRPARRAGATVVTRAFGAEDVWGCRATGPAITSIQVPSGFRTPNDLGLASKIPQQVDVSLLGGPQDGGRRSQSAFRTIDHASSSRKALKPSIWHRALRPNVSPRMRVGFWRRGVGQPRGRRWRDPVMRRLLVRVRELHQRRFRIRWSEERQTDGQMIRGKS